MSLSATFARRSNPKCVLAFSIPTNSPGLAHDLAASSFGLRQEIYEYWHGGDPNRNRINLLRGFDQREMKGRIKELLQHPLPHGEMMSAPRPACGDKEQRD